MACVYKSVCAELDQLTIKIIHLTEKHIVCKLEVEKLMNNGFVNIAKARYIMGTKCVSTLQLPTIHSNPIAPVTTVYKSQNDGYNTFKIIRKKASPVPSEDKIKEKSKSSDPARPDIVKSIVEDHPKSIRKRREFYLVDDVYFKELNEELQDEVSTPSSASTESLITYTDPIRMFGVLVPLTLRLAQKNFQEVLELLVKCATVQSEIQTVLRRYYHIKKVKTLMEDAAYERSIDLTKEKAYWTPEPISEASLSVESLVKTSDNAEEYLKWEGEEEVGEWEVQKFDESLNQSDTDVHSTSSKDEKENEGKEKKAEEKHKSSVTSEEKITYSQYSEYFDVTSDEN